MGQKIQIIRRMDSGHGGIHIQRCIGRQQLTHRAALQFIQHIAQAVRHFVAIDQTAPEHFLAACVLGVVGVVEDFHGGCSSLIFECDSVQRGHQGFCLTDLGIAVRLDG